MPRLSDSMEEGTVLGWMKSVGDEVALGDELVEIETDKANMVYESDVAGTLIEILADEGATLPIGEVIARIGDAGEAPAAQPAGERGRRTPNRRPTPEPDADGRRTRQAATPAPASEHRPRRRRRRRADQGLPARPADGAGAGRRARVAHRHGTRGADRQGRRRGRRRGSGRLGTCRSPGAPPRRSPPPPAERPAGVETARGNAEEFELTRLQQTVARRMAESKATAPHFYLTSEIDMSRAVEARKRIKAASAEGEVVPSFNDMVVKACAMALREFPRANGAYRDGKVEEFSRVNIGIAVAAQDALVVPTVFDADAKGLREIAAEGRRLAGRVRDGTITPPELSGGTFTVSNLGMFGVTSFSAVINPPQAAILAVGSIDEVPVVRDGEIVPGHRMSVTLACDHRILYGADGAQVPRQGARLT